LRQRRLKGDNRGAGHEARVCSNLEESNTQ
jgi:hypothetical protein